MKQTLILVGLIFGVMFGFSSADAAVDMFLKVETIAGESTDKDHKDWIDLLSWNWMGVTNIPSSGAGGGAAKSVAKFFDVVVVKEADKSSPKLFLAVARGDNIGKATVDITQSFESGQKSLINYDLSEVFISQYLISGGSSGSLPVEQISMNFDKVKMTYNQLDKTGKSQGGTTVTWDLASNEGDETIPEPPALPPIQSLVDEIDSFVDSGALNSRTAVSLKWLLNAAQLVEETGNNENTIQKLEGYVSRVNLFMTRGMISQDVGNALMDSADVIIKGKKILEN